MYVMIAYICIIICLSIVRIIPCIPAKVCFAEKLKNEHSVRQDRGPHQHAALQPALPAGKLSGFK